MRAMLTTRRFRIALIYGGLFALVSCASLSYLFWRFNTVLHEQSAAQIMQESEHLRALYIRSGEEAVRREIERRSRDPRAPIYWLAHNGEKRAGTLDNLPPLSASQQQADNWVVFSYATQGMPAQVRGRFHLLDEATLLFIGRDMRAFNSVRAAFISALITNLAVLVLLGILGGVWMAYRSGRHIEALSRAIDGIMAGNLHMRLPIGGAHDEIDMLSQRVNKMLARIETLVAANRQSGEHIAHDLRSPLNRLRLNLENAALHHPHAQEIDQAIAELDYILTLFDSLLKLAQVEAGHGATDFVPLDAGTLIRDIAALYEAVIEDAHMQLSLDVPEEPLFIKGDAALLNQAVVNLIENALKYGARQQGVITLGVHKKNDRVLICVKDQGAGMAEADYARVTQRFVRLDKARHMKGSGLGLPLVKAIAALHNGDFVLTAHEPHGLMAVLDMPLV